MGEVRVTHMSWAVEELAKVYDWVGAFIVFAAAAERGSVFMLGDVEMVRSKFCEVERIMDSEMDRCPRTYRRY